MNCQKGDIAIIIDSDFGLEGKILTCKKYLGILPQIDKHGNTTDTAYWETDYDFGGGDKSIADEQLRPIRDQPGEDETLTWAPVPHKETV